MTTQGNLILTFSEKALAAQQQATEVEQHISISPAASHGSRTTS